MPPRLPKLRLLPPETIRNPFICPSCRYRRAISTTARATEPQWPSTLQRPSRLRKASTISPVTNVNAAKQIPPAARELYEALGILKEEAGGYYSLSQLQVALKGLESQNAITRVALFGANGLKGVKRLARVLLADPLAPESEWERWLVAAEDTDERALFVRYNDEFVHDERHPLMRSLGIPASTLHKHKLEILIQAIPRTAPNETEVRDLLTPNLEFAGSATPVYAVVENAVHKALIYSEGFQSLPAYTPIVQAEGSKKEMLKGVINIQGSGIQAPEEADAVVQIDVERAEAAIQTIRDSLDNSVHYEQSWFDSGLPAISSWLQEGTASDQGKIKPTVRRLVEVLLSFTDARITKAETGHIQKLPSTAITPNTRSRLSTLLTKWSENAHTELRDQLDLAFDSPSWRKLAWWKLLWRVDDVTMIAADVLQRSFLTSAEKELAWLVGRIEQAGLYIQPSRNPTSSETVQELDEPIIQQSAIISIPNPALPVKLTDPSSTLLTPERIPTPTPKPYPQSITQSRHSLINSSIPPLEALAQRLLLHSLSTTVLTSSLSVLLYISLPATSVYEASTVAALGLVYSLRRLQKRWEEARESWQEGVREQGRTVLREMERKWGTVIVEGGKMDGEDVTLKDIRRAREAVRRVRGVLAEVEKGGDKA